MEINILMIKLAERKTICNCWKSANVNHTHARQQLCKLKLNMNKYSRSYMNVRASSMFVPAENWQNRKETRKNKNERKKNSNAKAGKITNIYPIQIDAGRAPLAPVCCCLPPLLTLPLHTVPSRGHLTVVRLPLGEPSHCRVRLASRRIW